MSEAAQHPHNVERDAFVERGGVMQPVPAPRFNCTAAEVEQLPARAGEHTRDVLTDWGVDADRVAALIDSDAGGHAEWLATQLAHGPMPVTRSILIRVTNPDGGLSPGGNTTSGPRYFFASGRRTSGAPPSETVARPCTTR
jgi:hypothetical protein